ncbi:MAG: ABC transporter permease [Campylobacterota bacterium]|nr:ABC transporter permease [Campylobacterota bacterium]
MEVKLITLHVEDERLNISVSDNCKVQRVGEISKELKKISLKNIKEVVLHVEDVKEFDSSSILLFIEFYERLKKANIALHVKGATKRHLELYKLLSSVQNSEVKVTKKESLFYYIGKYLVGIKDELKLFLNFTGESVFALIYYILHPSSIRFNSIFRHIQDAGVKALPIIFVTSFLIGVVTTFQGAVQLEKLGANMFVVDMITISLTRELAPLMTAVVVAGRSGSAYTAQLGVMKLTEEIDAMKAMGFNPYRFLVLPRIIALMVAMVLLIFVADIVGIFGGMVVAKAQLNITFSEFLDRTQDVLNIRHFYIGLIKAPFFALLIASISCFRGFQVSSSSESIGRYTTISVVNSIFLVILCDAIFSVILTKLNL